MWAEKESGGRKMQNDLCMNGLRIDYQNPDGLDQDARRTYHGKYPCFATENLKNVYCDDKLKINKYHNGNHSVLRLVLPVYRKIKLEKC
jgi:hypothetical protein